MNSKYLEKEQKEGDLRKVKWRMRKRMIVFLMLCILLNGCTTQRVVDSDTESSERIQIEEDSNVNDVDEEGQTESGEESKGTNMKNQKQYICSGSLDVYSISGESYIRSGKKVGDFGALKDDEYYSYALHFTYNGQKTLTWQEAYVVVDQGEPWYWAAGSLPPGVNTVFHIYHCNMQKLAEGMHTVSWYMDGKEIYTDSFVLTRDLNWNQITNLPSKQEIGKANRIATLRSPYMAVWFTIPGDVRYTEYSIEFKSDYFPRGSYYSLGNWNLDYSFLESQYESVRTDGISAYAGFQNIHDGTHLGIMSFWDVYCTDAAGNVNTIRPLPIYPKNPYKSGGFGGEGTGAQCMVKYNWEENHWYRFHLRCTESPDNGNTVVEFWVCDLETNVYTLICSYDTYMKESAFKGSIAIFLENYLTEYAGEIRTLEVRKPQYLEETTGQWKAICKGDMYPNGSAGISSYAGSYDYGVEGDRLWIMTTGVGNHCDDSYGKTIVFP